MPGGYLKNKYKMLILILSNSELKWKNQQTLHVRAEKKTIDPQTHGMRDCGQNIKETM